MAHPATSQVSEEEIVKLYYDYALGAGNGALPQGRAVSSFAFEPSWQSRPMPPRDKYASSASDRALVRCFFRQSRFAEPISAFGMGSKRPSAASFSMPGSNLRHPRRADGLGCGIS